MCGKFWESHRKWIPQQSIHKQYGTILFRSTEVGMVRGVRALILSLLKAGQLRDLTDNL